MKAIGLCMIVNGEGDPFTRLQEKRHVDYPLIMDADNLLELRSPSKRRRSNSNAQRSWLLTVTAHSTSQQTAFIV